MPYKTFQELKAALVAAGFTHVQRSNILRPNTQAEDPYRYIGVTVRMNVPVSFTGKQVEELIGDKEGDLQMQGFTIYKDPVDSYDWVNNDEVSVDFKARVAFQPPAR